MANRNFLKSAAGFAVGRLRRLAGRAALARISSTPPKLGFARSDWQQSLTDPTGFYCECVRYYTHRLDPRLKSHRDYYDREPGNRRGFGEDAFHVLWALLTEELKPANFLEIGVYRGQVITLVSLIGVLQGRNIHVTGISPFSAAGDSVSKYVSNLDYFEDTQLNFKRFDLPEPLLLRAYSTDAIAIDLIASKSWDLIYIDGNHDYEIVRKDWDICSRSIKAGGVIVLDDAGLTTDYRPPPFATKGHPGPSRVASEVESSQFEEILQVGHNRAFRRIS